MVVWRVFLLCVVLAGCATERLGDANQLITRQVRAPGALENQRATFSAKLEQRILRKIDAAARSGSGPGTLDFLVLSGGGEYGAFGVGILQGWPDKGPLGRPDFDVVTGISTGGLIAPFAFLGTEDSITHIDSIYRHTDRKFATLRDMLFFLPWRESFYDNSTMRERVHGEANESLARGVASAYDEGRLLLIGTTNIDLGRMRIWDYGLESHKALESGNYARMGDILMASAAIPAVFPPVQINGEAYVDGGVSQQAFLGFDLEQLGEIVQSVKRKRPHARMPAMRIWVIVNGPLDDMGEMVTTGWGSVAKRSIDVLMHYSMRVTLRHLQFGAALLAAQGEIPVEFRYVSVPNEFPRREPSEVLFDADYMAKLNALGRQISANPSIWRSTVGAVERLDAQIGTAHE